MNKRGGWGSMTDRVAAAGPPPAVEAGQPPPPPPPGPTAGLKHCWVVDHHGRLPALLLEWRRSDTGFFGRVVRPVEDAGRGWIVVEEWLPAAMLEPA